MACYADEADRLILNYVTHSFDEVFADVLHLFPQSPCRILDIGAGTGRHAAALAQRGNAVTAVEPTRELREAGQRLHAGADIRWGDDALPELDAFRAAPLAGPYDFILMAAVLMHFDETERRAILSRLPELLGPEGRLMLTLRHGPVPEGRRMFPVSHQEVAPLAERNGMRYVAHVFRPDPASRPGVSWTMLCLDKNGPATATISG